MAGRDITEEIVVPIGIGASGSIWQNTDIAYDVALGGMPFIYATNDARPHIRQTASFKKQQFDNGNEPGEQSLEGWWIRSQMSFHSGTGIKFYDPATTDEVGHYRFNDSKGVDVWTKGQVTLLKSCSEGHVTTGPIQSNGRPFQYSRSIKWNATSGILMHDEYDVDKIAIDGTVTHFIDYLTAGAEPVRAICDDGTYAYWVANAVAGGANKLHMYKKPLTGSSASTADETTMFTTTGLVISNAVMEYVKERIVMAINNSIYELSSSASALPTALYTHPATGYVYTSITASGPAIYVAGYNGIQSTIQKFTLSTTGVMPTLTSAVVAAELPVGEIVHKIHYYLGYMMIGTNKGIRAASVADDGSLTYGPLIAETLQPCYDFAARDHFVWCATGVDGEPGVIRIDLSNQLEPLRFAYANDIYYPGTSGHVTTSCAFADGTSQLAFSTAYASATDGHVYMESATELAPTGYITTGNIRYGTLEPKNFKRLLGRGDFTYGSMVLETVDKDGIEYDHITYSGEIDPVEVTTSQPQTAQEYVAYKFAFARHESDATKGPTFKGYQAKATIATPRQRVIQFYVYNMDTETDRYNAEVGYDGRSNERLFRLEDIEESGDIVTWQDLNTKESRQVQIESIQYMRVTPPDKESSGDGGILQITVRTV